MANIKQLGMAAGTFSVALGIGFVMQNGDALASRFGAETTSPEPAPFTAEAPVEVSLEVSEPPMGDDVTDDAVVAVAEEPAIVAPIPVVASAVLVPDTSQVQPVQEAPVQLAALDPELLPEVETEVMTDESVADAVDCTPVMSGVAGEGAMIKVVVSSPCQFNTAFTAHHQGMMFTAVTDDEGRATFTVPALAEVSVVIAAFDNGDGAVSTTVVPDFSSYDRAVLQWQGDEGVMLSAYEDDANYGESGHIHGANPGDLARLETAEGGFMLRLGDASVGDALMAEVYTFPSGTIGVAANVMLVAEAEITDANCGQELSAQSIQVSPTGETSALDLIMTMPECDAVGDVLILQNMFEDLTLASR